MLGVAAAEEQHRGPEGPPLRRERGTLLQEPPERRQPGAGADHDQRRRAVRRQPEGRGSQRAWQTVADGTPRKSLRRDAVVAAAGGGDLVDDGGGDADVAGVVPGGRGYGVVARVHAGQQLSKHHAEGGPCGGKVLHDVKHAALGSRDVGGVVGAALMRCKVREAPLIRGIRSVGGKRAQRLFVRGLLKLAVVSKGLAQRQRGGERGREHGRVGGWDADGDDLVGGGGEHAACVIHNLRLIHSKYSDVVSSGV